MKIIKIAVKIVIPILIFAIFVIFVKVVKINNVNCRSQYGECSYLLKEKLESVGNCDYFTCKKNIDSILSESWMVESFAYRLKVPLRMEVNIIEKKPKNSIISLSQNLAVQVDSKGLILDIRDVSNLPGYNIKHDLPNPGDYLSSEQIFAMELVNGAIKIQEIEEANLEKNYLTVVFKDGREVYFPLEGDRDFILGALTLILNELKKNDSDFKIGEEQVNIIDLRFKNPVLR